MRGRIAKLKGNWGEASNVLAICGFVHMHPLKRLSEIDGYVAEAVDYRTMEWYRPGVFSDDSEPPAKEASK